MPTSLVTGGAGFIGSHLCDYLVARGHALICVDNLDTGSLQNIEHIARRDDFMFVNHDLTQPLFLEEEIDYVFHLASPASPIDYMRLPLHTLEALTMACHGRQGVNTCIARMFNTYGPRMRRHDGRALTAFMHQALAEEPLTVFGDGSQTRSFCYVDDLVRGLVLLAESGEHAPVNLGSPVPLTLLELAEAVIGVTGSHSQITYEALPVDDPKVRLPQITRARELLGWEPEISLEDGLRRLAALVSSGDGVVRGAGPSFGG